MLPCALVSRPYFSGGLNSSLETCSPTPSLCPRTVGPRWLPWILSSILEGAWKPCQGEAGEVREACRSSSLLCSMQGHFWDPSPPSLLPPLPPSRETRNQISAALPPLETTQETSHPHTLGRKHLSVGCESLLSVSGGARSLVLAGVTFTPVQERLGPGSPQQCLSVFSILVTFSVVCVLEPKMRWKPWPCIGACQLHGLWAGHHPTVSWECLLCCEMGAVVLHTLGRGQPTRERASKLLAAGQVLVMGITQAKRQTLYFIHCSLEGTKEAQRNFANG